MNIVPAETSGLAHAVHILKNGGVVAHATETCYGLACDLKNPEAIAKLFAIKKRPSDQPVSALFSSIEETKRYVVWNNRADELARKYLPGPLTIILPSKDGQALYIVPALIPASQSLSLSPPIALRLSSHPIAQTLVHAFGSPISTTSANLHGRPETFSIQEVLEQFSTQENQPDLILDSGTLLKSPPSTIVDLSGEEEKIVRQGTVVIS